MGRGGRLIALDSSILMILAGEPGRGEKDASGQERMEDAIRQHRDDGDVLCIPAPAFAECCHFDLELLNKLRILPFGAKAAILANRWVPSFRQEGKSHTLSEHPVSRREVTIDAFILASAVAGGASSIYTMDPWFGKVAKREKIAIEILDLPPLPPQQKSLWPEGTSPSDDNDVTAMDK